MTRNQLTYHANAETARSNKAKEAETYRSNVAKETETNRSNLANEQLTSNQQAITKQHNDVTEMLGAIQTGLSVFPTVGSTLTNLLKIL
jgi:hypothetical protein